MKELEQAIEQARETELSISMQKAKKILRELQIQAAAADAAASLAAALQHQPCKPAELRVCLQFRPGTAVLRPVYRFRGLYIMQIQCNSLNDGVHVPEH